MIKTFIKKNKGIYPVYSWQTSNKWLYWYVNFYKYDQKILTWATYWVHAWTIFVREWKINIWRNSCWLKPNDEFIEFIDLDYIKYICEILFKFNAQWWEWEHRRLPQQIIKNLYIKLPIKENWNFDLKKQQEIADKYEKIEKIKNILIEELEYLEKVKVEI